MIKLYQFPALFGLPNASPFCMKVETYLRMVGLSFEIVEGYDLVKAPKGKFPFIVDGDRTIGDSGIIIEYLKLDYGDTLDAHLNSREKAISLAFIRLMDEHLYWSQIYVRWLEEEGWKITQSEFFQGLPAHLRLFVPNLARRNVLKQLWGHGMGRHEREEIFALANADITALSDYLGDQAFFHGDKPTTLDAVAYSYLANILWTPYDSPVKHLTLSLPNLERFCKRMKDIYYPGWQGCARSLPISGRQHSAEGTPAHPGESSSHQTTFATCPEDRPIKAF